MSLEYYLILSALLFTIGVIGVLIRRNAIIIFMCIELMLNAANLAFVAISRESRSSRRTVVCLFRDGCRCCRSRNWIGDYCKCF